MGPTIIQAALSAPPTCDARTGYRAGEFQEEVLWCNVTVGLRSYVDRNGTERRYCASHERVVKGRYPVGTDLERGVAVFHRQRPVAPRRRDPEDAFPCLGCGSPDPARIEGRKCSDCYDFGGGVFK